MLATSCISYFRRRYYFFIDSTIGYRKLRWASTLLLVILYFYRSIGLSYDLITYLIGFYLLQMLVSYFTPRGLDETEAAYMQYAETDGLLESEVLAEEVELDGQKPLVSSISELQIWERVSFAFGMGIMCTFFKQIQIDVFWPLLMVYFVVLVCYTIQKIIRKMEKYRYSVSDFGKKPQPPHSLQSTPFSPSVF